MGAIVDRSRELLGTSDRAIVLFRRLMLRLAAALARRQRARGGAARRLVQRAFRLGRA